MSEAEMNLLVKSYVDHGHTHWGSANCETNCISHLECTWIVEEGPHEHLVTHKVYDFYLMHWLSEVLQTTSPAHC